MPSYKELLASKEALDLQIEQARKTESAAALVLVRQHIKEFGFTAQQVFPWDIEKKTTKVAVKYYDPDTGSKWTGRGKPPKWIQGKDYTQFLLPYVFTPL